jgi:hypothetical protein
MSVWRKVVGITNTDRLVCEWSAAGSFLLTKDLIKAQLAKATDNLSDPNGPSGQVKGLGDSNPDGWCDGHDHHLSSLGLGCMSEWGF